MEDSDNKHPSPPSCGWCDAGLVFANKKGIRTAPYPFLCSCALGHRRLEKYARWEPKKEIEYEILEPAGQDWKNKGPSYI